LISAVASISLLAASAPAVAAQLGPSSARPSTAGSRLERVNVAAKLPKGSRVLGAVAAGAQLTGAVALRLPNPAAVTAFIDAVSNPRSADYHRYLARGQFASRFGPRSSAIAAVERQLKNDGLAVSSVSANHLLVNFKGSAAKVTAAFHTGLERVRLASGRIGQATTSAIRLPASIARYVQAVVGLDQLVVEASGLEGPVRHTHAAVSAAAKLAAGNGGPVACSDALGQQQFGGLTDQQVAQAYGVEPLYSAGDLGAGQTVDIYELEPFQTSDVSTFDECYFGADHTSQITVTPVDGGPGAGPGSAEAALDVEDVSALAPGARIHVFEGPNMDDPFGPLDTWNALAQADDANQVSTSWGLCETELQQGAPGVQQVENEIFEQTAAQGQTVFSSAGDDGSDDCASHASVPVAANLSVDDPASQPYVTSVGGTTMVDTSEPPKETVWNNGNSGGAGGGGISETWAMQPWQASMAVPQTSSTRACSNDPSGTADDFHLQGLPTNLPSGTTCRELPDVSAVGDPQTGITIFYGGSWFPIGGTSSSTPLWAGMLAEINGSNGCHSLAHGTGFVSPLLYQVASSSAADYADAFSDVTVGNNDNLGVGGAVDWPAGKGYDLATGLGTPRITDAGGIPGLASQLCTAAAGAGATAPPEVAALTQLTGTHSIAGGGTLQITGSDFGASKGSVYFGTVDAQVVTWTSTAVTVDVPAYQAPVGTAAGVGGRADVTVVTAGSPPESSAPSAVSVYQYTASSSGAPVVDYVSEPNGPTAGGNTVDIVGAALDATTSVDFGDVAASTFTVLNDNELRVTVPASDGSCATSAAQGMCAVAVSVTTPSGTSSGPAILPAYQGPIVFSPAGAFVAPAGCNCEIVPAPQEYDYAPVPSITAISPEFASENGTSSDVISGTGFNLLTWEWTNVGPAGQGFSEDFSLEGITPTQIVIGIPPAAPTTQPVSVPASVNSAGQLSNVSALEYAGNPILTRISKHVAAQADPGKLTITGQGLSDVNSVVFQTQGALSFLSSTSTAISNQSDTSLTVGIPQSFIFPTDVLVCSVTSCSAPDPAVDTFQLAYAGRPVVNSSGPASGPAHGGTIVTIQGSLDSEVTAVDFGTRPARILAQVTNSASGPLVVIAPPGTAGTKVSITITTVGGTLTSPPQPRSAANPNAVFTYKKSSPTAPRSVSAKAGVRSATITWNAPSNNGGSPVTGYVITGTAKGHKSVTMKVSAHATKVTFKKLAAGIAWHFIVQAVNKLGRGLSATSKAVTPRP
jgi:Pro-kumamolisin, activation domain/Fibronectin type III domain/IPT/TIG domain